MNMNNTLNEIPKELIKMLLKESKLIEPPDSAILFLGIYSRELKIDSTESLVQLSTAILV